MQNTIIPQNAVKFAAFSSNSAGESFSAALKDFIDDYLTEEQRKQIIKDQIKGDDNIVHIDDIIKAIVNNPQDVNLDGKFDHDGILYMLQLIDFVAISE